MSEWISVYDRLPPDNQLVLVVFREVTNLSHHNIHLGYFYRNVGWDLPYWDGIVDVGAWLAIPIPSSMEKTIALQPQE